MSGAGVGRSGNVSAMVRWKVLFGEEQKQAEFWEHDPNDYFWWWGCVPETLLPVFKGKLPFGLTSETDSLAFDRCLTNIERVMVLAFDCPFPDLVHGVCNRDFLGVPEFDDDAEIDGMETLLSAWQLFELRESSSADLLQNVFFFLFCDGDARYKEPFRFDEAEKEALSLFYDRIRRRYDGAAHYMGRVYALLNGWMCFTFRLYVKQVELRVGWNK